MTIWRPNHWVRSMSFSQRSLSVTGCSCGGLKGWLPAQKTSTPMGSVTSRTAASELLRSAFASATVVQMPVTSSTVFSSSSCLMCGCSSSSLSSGCRAATPRSTWFATEASSPVSASTSASSHSTPRVDCLDEANSIFMWSLHCFAVAGRGPGGEMRWQTSADMPLDMAPAVSRAISHAPVRRPGGRQGYGWSKSSAGAAPGRCQSCRWCVSVFTTPLVSDGARLRVELRVAGAILAFNGAVPILNKDMTLCISLSARPSNNGTRFHNHLYEQLGLNWIYKAFAPTDLAQAITGVRGLGIRGCAVSMPYKEDVIALVDVMDPSAKAIDSVNTIVNDGGRLTAYNTDYTAIEQLLARNAVPTDYSVLVRGAGGMAKATVAALRDAGFKDVTVVARNEDAGRALADQYGFGWTAELGSGESGTA